MKARAGIAWTATVILALLFVFMLSLILTSPESVLSDHPIFYATSFALLAASLLLLPPLWRHKPESHWHKARIAAAAILTITALATPVKTHAVKLDMPRPQAGNE